MITANKRLASIALVASIMLLAVAAISMPAVAANANLAGDDTDVIEDFNASSDDHVTYELSSNGTDFGTDGSDIVYLNMTVNDEHVSVSNDSIASGDTSHTFNLSQDEMGTIPGDAGGNTTVEVNAWGEDSETDTVNTSVQSFNVTVMFEDGYAVIYAGEAAADGGADGVSIENTEESKYPLGFGEDFAQSTVEAESVGINGSETEVTVLHAETNDSDAFASALDRAEPTLFGSLEVGNFVEYHQLNIGDTPYAVFNEEPPGSDVLLDGVTYAETTEVNGHDGYTVTLGDSYDDEDEIDLETRANDKYGIRDSISAQQNAAGRFGFLDI